MNVIRKSIGILILLVGIPTLIAVIWAVGVTKAAVSDKFISELPAEIVDTLPQMVDDVLLEIDREDMVEDPEARAWVKAVANAKTSPRELMVKIGLQKWLEEELVVSLKKVSAMIRGEEPVRTIVLDMKPLKAALQHEAITQYLVEVLEQLPPCDDGQASQWLEAKDNPRRLEDLPVCRPLDLESAANAVRYMQTREINDIPDEVNLVENSVDFAKNINWANQLMGVTYLLFLVPLIFLLPAALIGGYGKRGFFKWMGVSVIIGAGIAWIIASVASNGLTAAGGIIPQSSHMSQFELLMVTKMQKIGILFTDCLLNGAESVAGIICVIGIVFFALSFLVSPPEPKNKKKTAKPGAVGTAAATAAAAVATDHSHKAVEVRSGIQSTPPQQAEQPAEDQPEDRTEDQTENNDSPLPSDSGDDQKNAQPQDKPEEK